MVIYNHINYDSTKNNTLYGNSDNLICIIGHTVKVNIDKHLSSEQCGVMAIHLCGTPLLLFFINRIVYIMPFTT